MDRGRVGRMNCAVCAGEMENCTHDTTLWVCDVCKLMVYVEFDGTRHNSVRKMDMLGGTILVPEGCLYVAYEVEER